MVLLLWGQERFGETQWENCRVPEVAEGCGICIFSETTYFSIWCDFTIKWHLQNDLGLKPGSDPWCFFSRQTLDALLVTWRDGLFATHAGNPFISDIIRLKSTKTRFCKGGIKGWHGLAMFWGPQEVFGSIEQWCSKWRGGRFISGSPNRPQNVCFSRKETHAVNSYHPVLLRESCFSVLGIFWILFPCFFAFLLLLFCCSPCFCFYVFLLLRFSTVLRVCFCFSLLCCFFASPLFCFFASLLLHCSACLFLSCFVASQA